MPGARPKGTQGEVGCRAGGRPKGGARRWRGRAWARARRGDAGAGGVGSEAGEKRPEEGGAKPGGAKPGVVAGSVDLGRPAFAGAHHAVVRPHETSRDLRRRRRDLTRPGGS